MYDRYIPGYISTSASSAGDSSQNNRGAQIIEHQMVDMENNQYEQRIIASTGGELVSFHIDPIYELTYLLKVFKFNPLVPDAPIMRISALFKRSRETERS